MIRTWGAGFSPGKTDVGFPKTARLLRRRDFQFRPYRCFHTEHFSFLFTKRGQGRLGISISKKVLRRANARNRIRRLLREAFRLRYSQWQALDVHVVGLPTLTDSWSELKRQDVDGEWENFLHQLNPTP